MTSPHCPYCLASKAFHQRLGVMARQNHLPFYVLLPEVKNAQSYARQLLFGDTDLRQWSDFKGRVQGTPTILAIDSRSRVVRVWIGRLPADAEQEILKIMTDPASAASSSTLADKGKVPNLALPELNEVRRRRDINIVDVRERADRVNMLSGAKGIPVREILYRAPAELDPAVLQVLDCRSISASTCDNATAEFLQLQFNVATLGRGHFFQTCKVSTVTQLSN